MKNIKIVLIALLSLFIGVFASCSAKNADYTIEHSFYVNKTSIELEIGQTFDIVATYGENALTYTIDNKEVATITEKGKVTAVSSGVAYVTIKSGEESRICKITVVQAEYTIELVEKEIIITVGTHKDLQVEFKRNGILYNGNATWTSTGGTLTSDNATASFYAQEIGEYTITVESERGATDVCLITVINQMSDLD